VIAVLLLFTWVQLQMFGRPGGSAIPLLVFLPPLVALGILLSILPRGPQLGYPGRGLAANHVPELFDVLRDIARRTGQRMPRAVYLDKVANAGVFDRGLFLGRGLIIGIPFFEGLTIDELRAVLAHEFGHYKNRTGPITRTVYRATRTFGAASAAAG